MSVLFWEDVWVGDIPLKLEFPSLYEICSETNVVVRDFWEGDGWNIRSRSALGGEDILEWDRLMVLLDDYVLNEEPDTFSWVLEKSQSYSTKFMYRYMSFRGITNDRMKNFFETEDEEIVKNQATYEDQGFHVAG